MMFFKVSGEQPNVLMPNLKLRMINSDAMVIRVTQ